eukprot:Gb_09919 [translate_table: standard]
MLPAATIATGAFTCHGYLSSPFLGEPMPNKLYRRWSLLRCGNTVQQKNNALVSSTHKIKAKSTLPILTSRIKAVATEQGQVTSAESVGKQKTKYYYVIANAKFMLDEEEHFQELLCERLRNYGERNREQDFWLVIEPKFLDKFPHVTKRLRRPAVALVSTNGTWIRCLEVVGTKLPRAADIVCKQGLCPQLRASYLQHHIWEWVNQIEVGISERAQQAKCHSWPKSNLQYHVVGCTLWVDHVVGFFNRCHTAM